MGIRVVVAEDSLLVREGLAALIEAQPDLELAGLCEDHDQLMASVAAEPPDVVLTDIRMPPTGSDEGIRAASALRRSHPDVGVVVLSQYIEPTYALELFEDGSDRRAYLLKERVSDPIELVGAVKAVADGGSVIDPRVVEALVAATTGHQADPLEQLTPREREVLSHIAQGKNNRAIAESLVLSERAIEKHINSLFSKLDLSHESDTHRRVKAVLVFLAAEQQTTGG